MWAPEAEEDSTRVLAQLVIRDDVSKLPSHVAYVLQNRVALLPLADKDGIGVHLRFNVINQSDAGFVCAKSSGHSQATLKRKKSSASCMQQVCVDAVMSQESGKMQQIAAYVCSHAQNSACQRLARISTFHRQCIHRHLSGCRINKM